MSAFSPKRRQQRSLRAAEQTFERILTNAWCGIAGTPADRLDFKQAKKTYRSAGLDPDEAILAINRRVRGRTG